MKMAAIVAHAGAECYSSCRATWGNDIPVFTINGIEGMLPAYQKGFEQTEGYDILAFIHDDVRIETPNWVFPIACEFAMDPNVGLIGFGGGTGHGQAGLYRDPYDYKQLARSNFLSNMVDAENHGKRFTGSCDAAVLDGFVLIVRREILEKAGGWPLNTPIGYASYDYWLSCMTRRMGYRIRIVGVPCQHLGGQTFVKLGIGKDPKHWEQFLDSHRYIYDEFKDVLPYEVPR